MSALPSSTPPPHAHPADPPVAPRRRYFTGEHADHSSEAPSAKTLSVFKDPNATKRTVSSISFHPDGGRKLAVAFCLLQFQDERSESASNLS